MAPWNIGRYNLTENCGSFLLNGDSQIVFYHFQGLRRVVWRYYRMGIANYHVAMQPALELLYRKYARSLEAFAGKRTGEKNFRFNHGRIKMFVSGIINNDLRFL